jgi:glycosyltransferase involved in cell wall biosynthesis
MQRINILYVITKLELGGAQKQLLSLIRHLDRNRFKIFLFTAQDGFLIPETQTINGLTLNKSRCLARPINPLKDILALIEICRFIKNNGIEIVHTHSSKAGILGRLAAKLTGTRIILHTVHGWSFNDYQPLLVRWIFELLERFTCGFTDKIIVVSDHDKRKGIKSGIGADRQYALIRYGIDYSEFATQQQNTREELKIDSDKMVVGMIACFKPQKSPQDFIRLAFLVNQTLPETKFLLIGDGALRTKIEKLIRKFNLEKQVILTGWRNDIPAILSSTDVFVLTSLWEGLPISVLEAMASGRPVISTNTGGVEEVILEGKTGFLVFPGDVASMSEKLLILLKDKDSRIKMGEAAKDSLNDGFTLTRMVSQTANLYAELLSAKGNRYAN